MKKTKIIHKITFWYTLLTIMLLAFLIPILYVSISSYLYHEEVNQLHTAMVEAISCVEIHNYTTSITDTANIDSSILTIIWNDKQQVIFQNNDLNWLISAPIDKGQIRKIDDKGESWLVYDDVIMNGNKQVATIRVSSSFESIETALTKTQIVMLICIPLYLLLAVFGSLFIARQSLKPIRYITQTANKIGKGNLSSRITGIESLDEVGDLASTFNEMLEKIETLFMKERLFSSAASHELRTPVTVVMAYCESLLDEMQHGKNNTDDNIRSIEQMLKESKRMNTIISQLLLLTHGDEGKYKLILEKINIDEVINTVLQQMEEQVTDEDITLSYHGEENIAIIADQSLLTQMMLNLIENAIKYGKLHGHVDVFVKQESDFTIITVVDDGIGIEPVDLPHIFERFYRGDKSRDRSGSGLGLSIVEWIVKIHHGDIMAESTLGHGTVFTIKLKNENIIKN